MIADPLSCAPPHGLQFLNAHLPQPFLELFHGKSGEGESFAFSAVYDHLREKQVPADRKASNLRKFKLYFRMSEPGDIKAHPLACDKDCAAPCLA